MENKSLRTMILSITSVLALFLFLINSTFTILAKSSHDHAFLFVKAGLSSFSDDIKSISKSQSGIPIHLNDNEDTAKDLKKKIKNPKDKNKKKKKKKVQKKTSTSSLTNTAIDSIKSISLFSRRIIRSTVKKTFDLLSNKHVTPLQILGKWRLHLDVELDGKEGNILSYPVAIGNVNY